MIDEWPITAKKKFPQENDSWIQGFCGNWTMVKNQEKQWNIFEQMVVNNVHSAAVVLFSRIKNDDT